MTLPSADTIETLFTRDPASFLFKRADEGNTKARKTMDNPRRVDNGKWVGNVPEMISVCCGSYKPAWQRARGKKSVKRRDSDKLAKAGIVIRKLPRKEHKNEPMFLLIFPEKHFSIIERVIMTVYGRDETQDVKKDVLVSDAAIAANDAAIAAVFSRALNMAMKKK